MSEEINNAEDNKSFIEELSNDNVDTMTDADKDTLGEIGNISMSTCATTLYKLLGRRVNITTPKVSVDYTLSHLAPYHRPFLSARVAYTEGIEGYNMFIIKQNDALLITDLLMGGSGEIDPEGELDELAFSAISEVMNQMVGSSSTSLSGILHRKINISVPDVQVVDLESKPIQAIDVDEVTVKISFTMEIKDLIVTQIMQIIPLKVAKELLSQLMEDVTEPEPVSQPVAQPVAEPVSQPAPAPVSQSTAAPVSAPPSIEPTSTIVEPQAKVSEPNYQSFDNGATAQPQQQRPAVSRGDNMDLVMEVPLEVGVELGSCKKSIKEILGMSVGSIVVLEKMAGEMVEVKANGKLFAIGEVVVIEDSYGVRLTEIIRNK